MQVFNCRAKRWEYLCQQTEEETGGTVVLHYMPHELMDNYFVEVI